MKRLKLESKYKSKMAIIDSVEWDKESGLGSDFSGNKESFMKSQERLMEKNITNFQKSQKKNPNVSNTSLNPTDSKEIDEGMTQISQK